MLQQYSDMADKYSTVLEHNTAATERADDNIRFADDTGTALVVKKVPVSTSELQGRASTYQTGAVCDGGTMLSPDSHNTQNVLEHIRADTTRTDDVSDPVTRCNTQGASHQQSTAVEYTKAGTTRAPDISYQMRRTHDVLHQQSAVQEQIRADTTCASSVSYPESMHDTQDLLHQQSTARKHEGPETGHSSSDVNYPMYKGNTQDTVQQNTAQGHTSTVHVSHQNSRNSTQDMLNQQRTAQKHKGHSSSGDSYLVTQYALRQQNAAQEQLRADTTCLSDVDFSMIRGNTQDALQQHSAPREHKEPDIGHSSSDVSYPVTRSNRQDTLQQQSAAREHKEPDTGHSTSDVSHPVTRSNRQYALQQQSAAQEHKEPDTGHSSSDVSYPVTRSNRQDALQQQSAAREHKEPDTGHSTSDVSHPVTRSNRQYALQQQSAAQEHKEPDTGHSSSDVSYPVTRNNRQDALQQQSAAREHKEPDTGHSSSDVSYPVTRSNRQDALQQQSAAREYKEPDTGHSSSDVSYPVTRSNKQDTMQQQSAAREHTRTGTVHAYSVSYPMTSGNTLFTTQEHAMLAALQSSDQPVVSQQENTKQTYENLAHLKNKDHCWEEKNTVRDSGVDQVQMSLNPLMVSLISVNKLKVIEALLSEKCNLGKDWLTGNTLTVQGTMKNMQNALHKVICQLEIDGEDFCDDMKHCLQSLQGRLSDHIRFTERKGKFVVFAINDGEVTSEVQCALKQVRNKKVHVPLPVYAYAFLALKLRDVKKFATAYDPSLDVTISETLPEIILSTKRHSMSKAVEWFHNVVVRLNTAVKKVKYPHALYLQSVKAHNTLKKMEADTGCRIDVMVDGEQPVVTATSSNGHQLLVCHGPIAATDCKLIVLPLHAEQKLWSPSEKFVLRRSLLSEDLEMYHRFCTDQLELHCHGDYADHMVVVVPIPAYSEGEQKEQRRVMEVYKTVFTNLKDGQHSVAIFLKQWEMKTQKFMKWVLKAVIEALSNLGSKSCVTVVVYTDSIENAQNFCHIMQNGLPADWRQEPKTQKVQQGNIFERRLVVQDGEIQKVEADVVVNSTNVHLELKHGSVEKAILEAAGEELNKHLMKLLTELQPIVVHDVVATDSFNMKNAKKIFHVAIEYAPFSDENKDTVLHGLYIVTQRCLLKASMENHKSIAFPLLGTGRFKYPANDVKNTMTSAIKKFFTEMPRSSLEKVILVCFRQKGQEGVMSWLGWSAKTKHIEERIDCTNPSKTSEKEYSVAVCGHDRVDQCLETVMDQVVHSTPHWYMKMAPEIHELEEKRQSPVYHAEKGMNGMNSREINELQVDALKFLMKDEFDQAFEVKMNKGACTITLKKTSSADLLRKVDSLREDYVPLSAEEIARLEDTIDVSQDGIEAFIKTVRDQGKVAIFAFDFYAISSAKHHVKVKVGQVKVTTRAHRQFGSGESGVGRSVSLKAFNPPNTAYFFTKSGIKVSVYRANITKLSIEAIVNAANGSLLNGGGVAGAIAGAAGPAMDMECKNYIRNHGVMRVSEVAVTTGGQLDCKKVLHAVGPCWFEYTDKNMCKHLLSLTVFNCLCTANDLTFSAIALPSISSAIFGVPQEICAESYLAAVLRFDDHIVKKKLKHIHFVDVNDEMVVRIQNVFTAECNSNGSKLRAGQGHLPGPGGVSGTEGTRPHTPQGRHMQVTAPQSTDSSV